MQACDICDNECGYLMEFDGRYTCQECFQLYDLENYYCRPPAFFRLEKMHVVIEEIECDIENLELNTTSMNYSPNWDKHKFGPCKVTVEFIEDV